KKKSRRAGGQGRPGGKAERGARGGGGAGLDPPRPGFVGGGGGPPPPDRAPGRAPPRGGGGGPGPPRPPPAARRPPPPPPAAAARRGRVCPLTAAVRLGGVRETACLAFDGATDPACFEAYVGECLAPSLRPGDIVVMGNLACHKTAEVARPIAAAGAEVRYLP